MIIADYERRRLTVDPTEATHTFHIWLAVRLEARLGSAPQLTYLRKRPTRLCHGRLGAQGAHGDKEQDQQCPAIDALAQSRATPGGGGGARWPTDALRNRLACTFRCP